MQLDDPDFIAPISSLSNASVGQHSRHIIELFQTLLKGYNKGMINYDTRKRNAAIQTVRTQAISAIDLIINEVEKENKKLIIEHCISGIPTFIETNYFREVLYNLEHCIHHQALIKVGLLNFSYVQISETFGVAPSTIEYRKICVQ
ncbi:hypothetical protein Pf1_00504 [Flavobacterium columnare]|nr:hypothetical protein Pf1_00504 [Flavobacterium columnare]